MSDARMDFIVGRLMWAQLWQVVSRLGDRKKSEMTGLGSNACFDKEMRCYWGIKDGKWDEDQMRNQIPDLHGFSDGTTLRRQLPRQILRNTTGEARFVSQRPTCVCADGDGTAASRW